MNGWFDGPLEVTVPRGCHNNPFKLNNVQSSHQTTGPTGFVSHLRCGHQNGYRCWTISSLRRLKKEGIAEGVATECLRTTSVRDIINPTYNMSTVYRACRQVGGCNVDEVCMSAYMLGVVTAGGKVKVVGKDAS